MTADIKSLKTQLPVGDTTNRLSPYVAQIITPTGNDYLRLRTDPKHPALYYFKVRTTVDQLLTLNEPKLAPTDETGKYSVITELSLDIPPETFGSRLKRTLSKIVTFEHEKGLDSCFMTVGTITWKLGESKGVAPIMRIPCTLENKAGNWYISEIETSEMDTNPMLSYLLHGIGQTPLIDIVDEEPKAKIAKTIVTLQEKITAVEWIIDPEPIYFGCFTYNGIPLEEIIPSNYNSEAKQFWFENDITNQAHSNTDLPEDANNVGLEIPFTILPADSSQINVIMSIAKGKSLVIQGPPGTGKSQTIVNLIADAVSRGKSVAFIAQKETALNVVFNRLPSDLKNLSIRMYQAGNMTDKTNIFKQLGNRIALESNDVPSNHFNFEYKELESQINKYGELLDEGKHLGKITNYKLLNKLIPLSNIQLPSYELNPTEDSNGIDIIIDKLTEINIRLKNIKTEHWMWWGNIALNSTRNIKDQITKVLEYLRSIEDIDIRQLKIEKGQRKQILDIQITIKNLCNTLNITNAKHIQEIENACTSSWLQRLTNKKYRKIYKVYSSNKKKVLETIFKIKQLELKLLKLPHFEGQIPETLDATINAIVSLGLPNYQTSEQLVVFLNYIEANWQTTTVINEIFVLLNQIKDKCPPTYLLCKEMLIAGTFQKEVVTKYMLEAIIIKRNISVAQGQMNIIMGQYRQSCLKTHENYRIPFKSPTPKELKSGNAIRVAEKRGYALIQHVAKTTKARVSVRHLINSALPELQELFPCWLMTPSKLAHNLPRIQKLFDLVIIDEASQLLKAEAIGALARGKQFAIFGDSQQMPPSILMQEKPEGMEEMEDKKESILDWAASNLTSKSLLYHYRSEHHSLIAFSNNKFYEESLYCVPSQKTGEGYGITLHYLPDAKYTPKVEDPNIIEAKKVIQEVEKYIIKYPARSIGLVTFNIRQQMTIERLFEELRLNNNTVQEYCNNQDQKGSPVFIKNLETVQGDERDAIFISTVFGPDSTTGIVNQQIGINRDGDEKRINVLITRAKKENIIITSLRPEQLTTNTLGPQILRQYLEYAQSGFLPSALHPTMAGPSQKEFDSPWEKWFYDKLSNDGFKVENQVGIGRWNIDLAIKDGSGSTDNYVCGIELDGAAYHSSLMARERDALRQNVLEAHGWVIFRVWSTDYFNNPEGEYARLRDKIREQMK